MLLVLALVWALAQFPMVGTVGFTTLLICRVILGAGEGPAAAVATHAIYKWFPDEKRTLPTAVLSQGSAFGVILAVPALNWIIVNHSWHYAFGALGLVGLLWVVAWLILGKEGPLVQTAAMAAAEPRIPYLQLLTSRTFVGCCAATFGAYWALSLGLTWFTSFIVKGLGFSQTEAGWISILPWVFGAIGRAHHRLGLPGADGARRLHARGTRRAWRGAARRRGADRFGDAPCRRRGYCRSRCWWWGSGLCGSIYVVCAPMIGEFTPVSQRGAVIAIYGAIYTLAGIVAPLVMGGVIQRAPVMIEGYLTGFTINAVILIISGLLGLLAVVAQHRAGALAARLAEAEVRVRRTARLEHDPEKWIPVFRKDHAQSKT